jgi:membrane protease YdiL (CAAX protease family)
VIAALLGATGAAVGVLLLAKVAMGGWSIFGALLSLYGQMGVMLLVSCLFIVKLTPVPATPPDLPKFRAALLGVLYVASGYVRLGILLMALQTFVLHRSTPADVIEAVAQMRLGVPGIVMLAFVVVILGPVAEEVLFRGLLLPRLAAQLGPRWALWASAILFASLHYRYETFTLLVLFYGLILGWARLRTGGLTVPIVLHSLINGVVIAVVLATRGAA